MQSTRSLQGSWYQTPTPKEGQLRVYCFVNPPSFAFFHDVATVDEAKEVINREADIQLKDPAVNSNVFGLQVFVLPGVRFAGESDAELSGRGEWEDWENDDGYSIDYVMLADDDDRADDEPYASGEWDTRRSDDGDDEGLRAEGRGTMGRNE